MKCFSVHMRFGVMEGILLSGPAADLLIIGDPRPPIAGWQYRRQSLSVIHEAVPSRRAMRADIIWEKRQREPRYVGPFQVRHHLVCKKRSSDEETALVMVGAYGYQFLAFDRLQGWPKLIKPEGIRARKGQVTLVAHGVRRMPFQCAGLFGGRGSLNVHQRLYRMRKNTGLLLATRFPCYESDILVTWDGQSLNMVRNPAVEHLI